ncbi:MAG: aminotransferase class V-fold PLP-dependent enzyme [Rhodospirillales bacterium]|nr:aminotransferase class V-fold PLP-dependent enzyme [Rhodospirillales bacterium]
MIDNQRALFDIPADVTYLDCAANSPFLNTVRQAGVGGLDRKYHPWEIDRAVFVREGEAVRGLFAGLIGATASDIAITPSTAYGIATAAQNLTISAGQSILVLADQFPSNVFAWRELATASGARMVTVPWPVDHDWTAAVLAHMTAETAIVALPPCHWTDGSALDLVTIGRRCRELGAAFVVDATQAAGAVPLDVAAIQPDFLACSAYKWLLCPYTLGFLYAAPHRQGGRPLESHNLNHKSAGPGAGSAYAADYADGARRYDMSERFNFINIPMAIAAMEQVTKWGVGNIHQTLSALIDYTELKAAAIGWKVPEKSMRIGHYVGLSAPKPLPADVAARLQGENIFMAVRGAGLRLSPYLYNSKADIDRAMAVLARL